MRSSWKCISSLVLPAFTQILSGSLITAFGYFNPFLILGSGLTATGCGLLLLLDVNSGSGLWIGYQALAGIGLGLCLSVPIIVSQMVSKPEDVATATAIVLCKSTSAKLELFSTPPNAIYNQFSNPLAARSSWRPANPYSKTNCSPRYPVPIQL